MTPSLTPAQHFAAWRLCLCQALAAREFPGGLSNQLVALIITRIRTLGLRFARLAARIAAGTYVPRRRPTAPRQTPPRAPRRPGPLPVHRAWLLPLLPYAASFGGYLETLCREPEMADLLATAPEAMARALRPLFWMLAATPPPILARRRPAVPPPAPKPAEPPAPRAAPAARPASPPRRWQSRQNTRPRRPPLPA